MAPRQLLMSVLLFLVLSALCSCGEASRSQSFGAFSEVSHVTGFRLELTPVDAFLDEKIINSPERLRIAAESSKRRAQALANIARQSSSSSSPSSPTVDASPAPVYSDNGAYVVTLAVGTPPQSFTAILDTGSDLVWRQSKPCEECFNQTGPLFDPSKSSTFSDVTCSDSFCTALPQDYCDQHSHCEYTYSYGDGSSTSGNLAYDTIAIGGLSKKKFAFGAGTLNSGDIGSIGTAGLVGMGGGPLSLPSQLASDIDNKFSYCLVTWTDSPKKTSPLLFGSSAALSGSGVVSTPFVRGDVRIPTFYYVTLNGISVGGKALDIPAGTFHLQPDGSGGVIFDSGTTVTFLVDAGYTPLRKAYASAIHLNPVNGSAVGFDLCYEPPSQTIDIPSATFHFEGADIEIPAGNIFINYQGHFCLAFLNSASLQFNFNIFGNIQQQNFQLLYDKGSNNQLSLKPVNCDTLEVDHIAFQQTGFHNT